MSLEALVLRCDVRMWEQSSIYLAWIRQHDAIISKRPFEIHQCHMLYSGLTDRLVITTYYHIDNATYLAEHPSYHCSPS